MSIAIDMAGRLVLPKPVRDRFNLVPGTALELEVEADGVRLRVARGGSSLPTKQGVMVHHGPAVAALDVADFIRGERDARVRRLAAPDRAKP